MSGDDNLDESSRIGAQRLADRIVTYWRGRGYPSITAGVVELKLHDNRDQPHHVFSIVSNIGPKGFPPSRLSA